MCSRVLVVEDEELVGLCFREALLDRGFEVHLLAEGRPALRALASMCICAAVIDVGLPDLMGDELAAQLRSLHPLLPILLVTGYDEQQIRARFPGDRRLRVLGKPLDAPVLISELEALVPDRTSALCQ